jgi:hypothetical protein
LYTAPEIKEFGETLKGVSKIVGKSFAYINDQAGAKIGRERDWAEALSK